MSTLLKINPQQPESDRIREVVECLKSGGIIIYPTDGVYGMGCDITHKKAVERLCRLKGLQPEKAKLSCICENVKILGEYAIQISTPVYKILKKAFPGPYTMILRASKKIPKHFQTKSTVGIRIPAHPIPIEIVHYLGNPIANTSLPMGTPEEEADWEYSANPEWIYSRFASQVNMVIDGGYGNIIPSTIIDLSRGEDDIEVIREGLGELEPLGIELG